MQIHKIINSALALLAIAIIPILQSWPTFLQQELFHPPASLSVIIQNHLKKTHSIPSAHASAIQSIGAPFAVPEKSPYFPDAIVVESAEVDGPEPNQSIRIKILKTNF
jgi:hypothetical protein